MSKPQQMWAARKRAELILEAGSRCWKCGSTSDLEFDHPFGRDWKPRKLCQSRRVVRIRKEWEQGLVQILCHDCNGNRPSFTFYDPPPGVVMPARALAAHGDDGSTPF